MAFWCGAFSNDLGSEGGGGVVPSSFHAGNAGEGRGGRQVVLCWGLGDPLLLINPLTPPYQPTHPPAYPPPPPPPRTPQHTLTLTLDPTPPTHQPPPNCVQVGYFHCYQDGVDYVFVDNPAYHHWGREFAPALFML